MTCQQFKTARGLQQWWQERPPVDHPLERISIDITDMGGGATGDRYVLTIVYHFSRFVNYHPLNARTSEQVIRSLDSFIDSYGVPRILLADNAREFCSETFRRWCENNGIKLIYNEGRPLDLVERTTIKVAPIHEVMSKDY